MRHICVYITWLMFAANGICQEPDPGLTAMLRRLIQGKWHPNQHFQIAFKDSVGYAVAFNAISRDALSKIDSLKTDATKSEVMQIIKRGFHFEPNQFFEPFCADRNIPQTDSPLRSYDVVSLTNIVDSWSENLRAKSTQQYEEVKRLIVLGVKLKKIAIRFQLRSDRDAIKDFTYTIQ